MRRDISAARLQKLLEISAKFYGSPQSPALIIDNFETHFKNGR